MPVDISHYADIYKEVSSVPTVASATILPGNDDNILCIHSSWNSQDLVKLEKVCFSRDYIFDNTNLKVVSTGLPYDISSVSSQSFSKSGKRLAILREKKSAKNSSDGMDLEIWNGTRKEKTFELTDHEDHGKVNTNAFGCLAWSSDENYLLYTAEAKQFKSSSFFKISSKNEEKGNKQTKGEEYVYREEWGENFVGSHHSVLVILDVRTGQNEVLSIDKLYHELSIGEAIWGPNDEYIVFVGYQEFPRRLGVRSCTNRRSAIYSYHRETKDIKCISGEGNNSVRSPRFSLDFKTLIYLENKMGGPHYKGSKLQKFDWDKSLQSTLVETVDNPNGEDFPGIYTNSMVQNCWFKNYLFLSSQWRSFLNIICININDGKIQKIDCKTPSHPDGTGESFGACTVLNLYKNFIIAEFSSLNIEPCLAIGVINKGDKISIDWKFLDPNTPCKHSDINWSVVKINVELAEYDFEIILVTPKEKKEKYPLILRPHGGPHAAYTPAFSKNIVAFTKLHYINCLVNYRGSIGFGEDSINSLPGNVGGLDVANVQLVAKYLQNLPNLKVGDIFMLGGSHGGFLSAHMVGQYPNFYKAAVLLNPVIDISAMSQITDIPDWNWVEGGCGDIFDPSDVINPDDMKMMWEKSPIKYAKNVCVPVLLLLGNKDLRVPYSQGLNYYHILKARKVPVSIYVYEDNHSLSKTPHDADAFMQMALWFQKYSSQD